MIKRFVVPFCMLVLALMNISCIDAALEISDVFRSGAGGYHTYRIPVLLLSTNGALLAFCEGRKGGAQDNGAVDLLLRRSLDGGKAWKSQQVIWSDKKNTCGNPAPVVDQTTGIIWLLMTWNFGLDREDQIIRGTSKDIRRVFLTHSDDEGMTWTKPLEITDSVKKKNWGWYATGPVNGIQLTRGPHKGRLLIPANHTEMNSQNQPVTRSHVIFSDDHGQTWQIGGIEEEKTNESTIVELTNGSVLQNMRSYHAQNRRAVATSHDGGLSWSAVKLDRSLVEPICQASILRCTWPESGGKNRVLFSNPASVRREKLTIRVSYDDCATWPVSKVIGEGPAAYSSLAMLPGESIACLFERGDKSPYEKISLARFPLSWLEAH